MKQNILTNVFVLGLILTIGAGCKHHPPGVTQLDKHPGTTGTDPSLGPGGKIGGPGGESGTTGGIPQGLGHQGWPEDPSFFKADTVYFDFDSSSVKPAEKPKISDVASHLKSSAN